MPSVGERWLPGPLPRLDVLAQPEAHPTTTPIDHRPREILVAAQIRRHRVVMREAKHRRDLTRRDQVFGVHPRSHEATAYEGTPLHPTAWLDYFHSHRLGDVWRLTQRGSRPPSSQQGGDDWPRRPRRSPSRSSCCPSTATAAGTQHHRSSDSGSPHANVDGDEYQMFDDGCGWFLEYDDGTAEIIAGACPDTTLDAHGAGPLAGGRHAPLPTATSPTPATTAAQCSATGHFTKRGSSTRPRAALSTSYLTSTLQ